jgi:hypothetical protein
MPVSGYHGASGKTGYATKVTLFFVLRSNPVKGAGLLIFGEIV